MERHEEALASYQDAFTLFRQVGDTPHQAICLINIADTLHAAGRRKESLTSLQEALGVLFMWGVTSLFCRARAWWPGR